MRERAKREDRRGKENAVQIMPLKTKFRRPQKGHNSGGTAVTLALAAYLPSLAEKR